MRDAPCVLTWVGRRRGERVSAADGRDAAKVQEGGRDALAPPRERIGLHSRLGCHLAKGSLLLRRRQKMPVEPRLGRQRGHGGPRRVLLGVPRAVLNRRGAGGPRRRCGKDVELVERLVTRANANQRGLRRRRRWLRGCLGGSGDIVVGWPARCAAHCQTKVTKPPHSSPPSHAQHVQGPSRSAQHVQGRQAAIFKSRISRRKSLSKKKARGAPGQIMKRVA